MPKTKVLHRCISCGATAPQWAGRCATCGEWNTLEEELSISLDTKPSKRATGAAPVLLSVVKNQPQAHTSTGVTEVDRVLGGGLMPGSVTLLGGEPGIGKSTLVLQMCAAMAKAGAKCLVVTGEESAHQVARRAERLGANVDDVLLLAETDIERILGVIDSEQPNFIIVDSIQTMSYAEIGSSAGSVSQVRECSQAFVTLAKQKNVAVLLVGHVTKEGTLAGPRVLEHVVDTVLEFDGDRHHGLRFLRAAKHRFGSTDEVGVMEMTETGLHSVPDASTMFLVDRRPGITGSVVVPTLQGRRPMLVELQTLVNSTQATNPRRLAQGFDNSRFAVVLAVMQRSLRMNFFNQDVYASVVGGIRIDEPGGDLPMVLALASSLKELAMSPDVVAVGEVGLGGEVRSVGHMAKRLAEVHRMGFSRAVVPKGSPDGPHGLRLIRVSTVNEAVDYVL